MSNAICKRARQTASASFLNGASTKLKSPRRLLLMVAGLFYTHANRAMALDISLPLSRPSITSLAITIILTVSLVSFSTYYFKIKRRYINLLQKIQRQANALLAASSATWYWDLESDLVTFSPALQTTLGNTKNAPPKDSRVWTYLLHPDDLTLTNQLMQDAQLHSLTHFHQTCRLKNNQEKYLRCIVSGSACAINRKGQPLALAGTILFSREETLTASASFSNHASLSDGIEKSSLKEPLPNNVTLSNAQKTKQLLIVDDDPFIRQMLSGLLSNMKINAILASSGKEAMNALSEHHIDLVLMDLEMPGESGRDILKLIRGIPNYASLPVISMTAGRPEKQFGNVDHSGFNEGISKPIDPQKLKRILNHYLKEEKQVNVKEKQEETPKIMDLDIAMYYVEGNRELLTTLLDNIHNDHCYDLEKFKDYRKNHNTHDAQRILHTLKGIAGTIGATELERSCETLEHQEPYQKNALVTFEQAFLVLMKEIEIQNGTKRIKSTH